MLSVSAESISRDLAAYGEDEAANWVLTCSDDELERLCSVAEWLLHNGSGILSGGSMLIAEACALAAVYVREGAPRNLARARRRAVVALPVPWPGRRLDFTRTFSVPREYGVGNDAREFWARK